MTYNLNTAMKTSTLRSLQKKSAWSSAVAPLAPNRTEADEDGIHHNMRQVFFWLRKWESEDHIKIKSDNTKHTNAKTHSDDAKHSMR